MINALRQYEIPEERLRNPAFALSLLLFVSMKVIQKDICCKANANTKNREAARIKIVNLYIYRSLEIYFFICYKYEDG